MIHKLCLFAGIATLLGPGLVWGQSTNHPQDMSKLSDDELKNKLTPEQYHVTRLAGTEPPFNNAYWNNHAEGLYVDVISGAPLFSSKDKFDSGTGWPSFTRPIDQHAVVAKQDTSHGMTRDEVVG
ncbi:MAG TPA: peptide-methionine (R)-S-oxide reductase MsrB, partial [Chthoniobacterales bacterium]|nr:peptide-methionine (R)-S-oxide reductase MsrB [Chthoniobacterales bacterium]